MNEITIAEPFPLFAVPRVWSWIQQSMGSKLDDFAPKNADEFVDQFMRDSAAGERTWAVMRDGGIGGLITSGRITPCVATIHAVFKREFWGRKTTAPALGQVCEAVFGEGFEHGGVEKLETTVFPDNRAVIGMISFFGGEKEGLLKGHTLRGGKPIDVVIVGLQRSVFNGKNWRRLQLTGYEQPVPKQRHDQRHDQRHRDDGRDQDAGSDAVRSGHLRGAPQIPIGPERGGQSLAGDCAESGQPELLGVG